MPFADTILTPFPRPLPSPEERIVIKTVLIVGAGSAGLIAAIGLRRKIPSLSVRCVLSALPVVSGIERQLEGKQHEDL